MSWNQINPDETGQGQAGQDPKKPGQAAQNPKKPSQGTQNQGTRDQWTLLDASGESAVTFTSFLDIDLKNTGIALSYPVEEGGFASYNKVENPLGITVTLGIQGADSDFEAVLAKLNEYKTGAVTLAVATPAALYEKMTLETYSYKRARDAGAGMLVVVLTLKEVREVVTQTTTTGSAITKPKNPTSAGKRNTGKTQAGPKPGLRGKAMKRPLR